MVKSQRISDETSVLVFVTGIETYKHKYGGLAPWETSPQDTQTWEGVVSRAQLGGPACWGVANKKTNEGATVYSFVVSAKVRRRPADQEWNIVDAFSSCQFVSVGSTVG